MDSPSLDMEAWSPDLGSTAALFDDVDDFLSKDLEWLNDMSDQPDAAGQGQGLQGQGLPAANLGPGSVPSSSTFVFTDQTHHALQQQHHTLATSTTPLQGPPMTPALDPAAAATGTATTSSAAAVAAAAAAAAAAAPSSSYAAPYTAARWASAPTPLDARSTSSSSWVSWGPPKAPQPTSVIVPPDSTPLPAAPSPSESDPPCMPAMPALEPKMSPFDPPSWSSGALQPGPALHTGPAVHGRSAPSLSHLLYGDVLLQQQQQQQLVSSSGSGLIKKSSGGLASVGSGGKGAGSRARQSLSSGSGHAVVGRASVRVAKDTTRRKAAEIARLEQELRSKLSLASGLEKQREELQRREKLLKLQVETNEKRLMVQSVSNLKPHLVSLLQGFRSTFNRHMAEDLLEKLPADPKQFTLKDFMITWQSFVHEIGAAMLEDPDGSKGLCRDTCDCIANWLMYLWVHTPEVVLQAAGANLQTGEEQVWDLSYWEGVLSKLELTKQQVEELELAYSLYSAALQRTSEQHNLLLLALSDIVQQDLTKRDPKGLRFLTSVPADPLERSEQLFQKVMAAGYRYDLMDTMLSYLVFNLFTPRQQGLAVFHSFPSLPNALVMLAIVGKHHHRPPPFIPRADEGGSNVTKLPAGF